MLRHARRMSRVVVVRGSWEAEAVELKFGEGKRIRE